MRNANTSFDKHKLNKNKKKYTSDSEQSETEEESSKKIIIHKTFLKDIADTLSSIVSQNKNSKNQNTAFSHGHIPKISLFEYLLRIQKYSGIENSTIIIALIYIDRICIKKGITLTRYNIHRILFTSVLISIKYNEDIIYDYLYYSKIGGITPAELSKLENEFLKMIGFELFVSEEVYNKYYSYLNSDDNTNND